MRQLFLTFFILKSIHFFLVYDFESLIVSIGGYLGLFVGLSANDVFSFIVDLGDKFATQIRKNV